ANTPAANKDRQSTISSGQGTPETETLTIEPT
ncbi:hypothetical protein A2U01_0101730, partial [Trifolium medium]|nr:hypothetical protein [Trifolium medium]